MSRCRNRDGRTRKHLLDGAATRGCVCSVSFVQFSNGYRADLKKLGAACRANRHLLVVDGMQGIGNSRARRCGEPVDILACGGQNGCCLPGGSGFVYVRKSSALEPRHELDGFADDVLRSRSTTRHSAPTRAGRDDTHCLDTQLFDGDDGVAAITAETVSARMRSDALDARADREVGAGNGVRITSPTRNWAPLGRFSASSHKDGEAYHGMKRARAVVGVQPARRLDPAIAHCYNTSRRWKR